jgi:hypothetical protein
VALQVWVQREPVRERMDSRRRSGALEISEGVGSDWAAKWTDCRSSDLATVESRVLRSEHLDGLDDAKATCLFSSEYIIGCGTGGRVAYRSDSFDELGAV